MAAVTLAGEVVSAAIQDPMRADTSYAIQGGGAWMESAVGEHTALQVASPVPVGEMECVVATNFCMNPCARRSTLNCRAWA